MIRLFLLIILAFNTGFPGVTSAQMSADKSAPVILIIGDSLSSGYGIDPNKSWVSLLGQRLKEKSFSYQLINASISGNTTINGINRLQALLEQYQPAMIIIELGGNDGLRGLSINSMQQNLSKMISLSQQYHAVVLLAGIKIPPNYGKRYTEAFYNVYLELSRKHQVTLIPFLLDSIGDNAKLMQQDGVHPTEEAQTIILKNVWPYVKAMLEK